MRPCACDQRNAKARSFILGLDPACTCTFADKPLLLLLLLYRCTTSQTSSEASCAPSFSPHPSPSRPLACMPASSILSMALQPATQTRWAGPHTLQALSPTSSRCVLSHPVPLGRLTVTGRLWCRGMAMAQCGADCGAWCELAICLWCDRR